MFCMIHNYNFMYTIHFCWLYIYIWCGKSSRFLKDKSGDFFFFSIVNNSHKKTKTNNKLYLPKSIFYLF